MKPKFRNLLLASSALLSITSAHAATLTWDTVTGDGAVITDGAGTWSDAAGNWNNAGADVNWNNATPDNAIFGGGTAGAADTVTLGTAITAGTLTFNTPNGGGAYTLTGNTLTLTGAGAALTSNTSSTVNSNVTLGAGSNLVASNAGTLTLGGTLNAGSQDLVFQGAGDTTVSGTITNMGANLWNDGTGTLTFNTTAPISMGAMGAQVGTTRLLGSTAITLTSDNWLRVHGILQMDGGTLNRTHADNGLLIGESGGGGTLNQTGGTITISGGTNHAGYAHSGAANFSGGTFTATGTWNNSVTSTSSMATSISGTANVTIGTLQFGAVGTPTSTLSLTGGTLTLNNGLTYGAGTHTATFNGGVLRAGSGSFAWANNANVTATLTGSGMTFDTNTFNASIGQNLGGTGLLTKEGTGTLTLTGITSYGGATTVNAGTLFINNGIGDGFGSNVTINNGGTFKWGADQLVGNLVTFTVNTGGTLDLNGKSDYIGNVVGSGTLTNTGTVNSINLITPSGTFSGSITGAVSTNLQDPGTWTLSGTNNYTGATTVTSANAILRLGDGGTTGALTGTSGITIGGNLTINRSNSFTQATDLNNKAITGGGGVTQAGSGTTTLTLANTYTGATTISAGTLKLGTGGSLDNLSSVSIAAGATFDVTDLTAASATYTWNTTSLSASGTATAATLAGTAGGTIDMGSKPIILTYNGSNPALTVSGATLSLNNNPFTVNGSSVLADGDYNIVTADTAITDGSTTYPTPTGTALTGKTGSIAVSGTNVVLHVSGGGGVTYANWALTNAPTTGSNPNADEDGDGVTNGVEYVLGGTIGTNDPGKLPKASIDGGDVVFTFERDQLSIGGTTSFVIELSTDLTDWTTIAPYAVPDNAVANNPGITVVKDSPTGFDTVTLRIVRGSDVAKFGRLNVSVP